MNKQGTSNNVTTIARYLLGTIFFVFGLNGFLHFIPQPPVEGEAGAFLGALAATGYMFPVVKGVEVLAGLALLSNRFSALALVLLAPITVNIFLFHAVLAPAGMALTLAVLALHLTTAWGYRSVYRPLFVAKVHDGAPTSAAIAEPARAAG